ncbi:hypothetical protein IW141_005967 [Coemansia sp. RSA 355]|nr:hypothetical protein IW141_005967 [Coemansia sp. RSA 355]
MNLNTASGTPVLARITSITCDTIVVVIGTAFPEVPFESRAAFKGHKLENRARQLEAERMRREAEQVTSRRRRVQKQQSMYRSRSKQAKAVMLLEDADVSCIETEETGRRPNGPMVVFCTGSIAQVVDADNSDIMNHPFLKIVAPEDIVHVSRFFDRMAASDDVVFETFSLLQRPHVIEGDIFVSDEENMRVVVEALGANVQDGIAILVRKIKVVRAPTRDTMGNYVRAAVDADIDMENLSLAELVSSDPETSEAPEQMNVWALAILAAHVVALPTEQMNNNVSKRQIPYGGIIAFGNSPGTIQALQPKQPCPDKSGKPRGPLLGLVDIALDVHV